MVSDEIYEVEVSGCNTKKRVIFDLQVKDSIEQIINIAEEYQLAMAQGLSGYVEVWIDDDKNYRCQATDVKSIKKGTTTKGIQVKNKASLQVGSKDDVNSWLQAWWPKVNQF
ncbi:hypothetical protein BM526_19380 (plasmid) [Alteromonas mediterranea]|uniref:hypothetical protein n=1 Tax=Alteromonas mediterranea TaxID=314275 RepID=UPI0009034955|nr:hypothetical protein [Alteromonas mediterranea]APE04132.1 hypothetical protein BM526_19380 [Alteromonas mediterranea]